MVNVGSLGARRTPKPPAKRALGHTLCVTTLSRSRKPGLRLSIEVLENLVRTGPLVGRDDKLDGAAPTPIQWMIGNACRVDPERSQLVAPRHCGALIGEGADGLPPLKARIVDRHQRVFGRTAKSLWESHRHEATPRRWAGRLFSAQRESLSSVTANFCLSFNASVSAILARTLARPAKQQCGLAGSRAFRVQ
jgi:hypothetical protein